MGEEKKEGIKSEYPKTYVITSAQSVRCEKNSNKFGDSAFYGAPNDTLIKGLEHLCERNDGELKILTMQGMNAADQDLHPFFGSREDVYSPGEREQRLNNNVLLSDILVPPQNVDPSTGRDRHVQQDQTMIFAHSKQRLKAVASGNAKLPKLLMTTGACTYPNYNLTNNRGDLAMREHAYGAVIVDIIDDTFFNARHIRAHKNGKFIDMGEIYNGKKKVGKAKTEALILGDIHCGEHDPKTMQANYEMIKYFDPKRLFLHDFVNGHSVNPFERKNPISRVRNYNEGWLSIEEELKLDNKMLCEFAKAMGRKEVNVVYSNHQLFISNYVGSGDFMKELWNVDISLKLAGEIAKGNDPIEYGIRMMGKLPSNVNFLKLRDDYKIWGWQLASHGHKGISGARGSVRSREIGFGKSISGHTHAPEILRNTVIVGTSTKLNLPYVEGGMTRWLGANAVLYEGGLVQLLPVIDGKWRK